MKPTKEAFLARTRISSSGCVEWTGHRDKDGYGVVTWKGPDGRSVARRAHRHAWAELRGPIPPGVQVLHRCDNPPCILHLFLGSQRDNILDMIRKDRHPGGALARPGESHPNAKLTADEVDEIRRRYADGGVSYRTLGAEFGVDRTNIGLIVRGRSWANPRGEPKRVRRQFPAELEGAGS